MSVCYAQPVMHQRQPNIVNVVSTNGTLATSVGPTVGSGATAVPLQNGQLLFAGPPRRVGQPQLMCIQPKFPVQYQSVEPPPVLQAEVDVARSEQQVPPQHHLYPPQHFVEAFQGVQTAQQSGSSRVDLCGETTAVAAGQRRLVLREDMNDQPSHC